MSKLLELREKRDKLAEEIKRFAEKANDEKQEWSNEDQANYERCNADYDANATALEAEEKRAAVGARATEIQDRHETDRREKRKIGRDDFRPAPAAGLGESREVTEKDRGLALRGWYFSDKRTITDEEMDACQRMGVNPYASEFGFNLCTSEQVNEARAAFVGKVNTRTLSTHIGASGGFTYGDAFVNSLEMAMLHFGGMRQVADIIRTDSGNTLAYPTANDTSNTGEIIAESTEVSTADPSFGAVNLYAHKYSSKMVKVPVELLEDSAFNIPVILGGMLGERLGRITNTHFTTGDGAAKPRGITTMSTLGKTTAGATAITMDEVIDLIHSVDIAYRTAGCSFMFKDTTLQLLRKLKDGQGQYLWSAGTQAGEVDRIWGFPYTINNDMPAATSGLKSMLFGQLNKYKIREVRSIRLRRLVERYAEVDQEGFVAFARYDGVLVDAGVAPVKHMLQA